MSTFKNCDFGEFYQKYGPMVLRRCKFMLLNEEMALDAMQDVFLQLIENRSKVRDFCSSLFYVTATRVCLNKIRANKVRSGPDFDSIADIMADDFSELEIQKVEAEIILDNIFAERDSKDALIATLHYVDGLTLEETAEQIGMSVSGIRKRIVSLKKHSKAYISR